MQYFFDKKPDSRKPFIKSCLRHGFKKSQVARFLGVSRQRIDQILKRTAHEARMKVGSFIKTGDLKQKPCEYPECGKSKVQAHHFDYNSPLDVVFLCIKHHKEIHVLIRNNWADKPPKPIKFFICKNCDKKVVIEKGATKVRYCSKQCQNSYHYQNYHKVRYHTDPKYKENHRKYIKKYMDKMKQENPEALKEAQKKYAKKYYKKNREEIKRRARLRWATDQDFRERQKIAQRKYELKKRLLGLFKPKTGESG